MADKLVHNNSWSFNSLDDDFHVLTTTAGILGKSHKSLGLTGALTPGNTKGDLISNTGNVTRGEVKITNNSDADKVT